MKNIAHIIRDWYIKGIQLNVAYKPHWNEIKSTFYLHGQDLNKHGPILTMNELKNIRVADKFGRGNGLFVPILQAYPIFCRKYAEKAWDEWIRKPENEKWLKSLDGTILDIDRKIEKDLKV